MFRQQTNLEGPPHFQMKSFGFLLKFIQNVYIPLILEATILPQNFASEDLYFFKRDFSIQYLAVTQSKRQKSLIITAQISNKNKAKHGLKAIVI